MKTLFHLVIAALLVCVGRVAAQNLPHIGYVYPAGGRQGSTFEITVGGQFLPGVTNVFVTGGGVTAQIEDYSRPMTQREFNEVREQLEQLRNKRTGTGSRKKGGSWTPADERLMAELRRKLANAQRRPPNPAIAETVTLAVTIAPDAQIGTRELRLRTPAGLSNPMTFKVGHLPEVAEKPEKTMGDRPVALQRPAAFRSVNPPEMQVTLPVVVNGQIMAGDVDRIKFRARKGQKLVIATSARELVPYLPDAVPGWFQATLTLFDDNGKEIAYDDDFRFHPDPVLFFDVPQDGQYAVEIKDSIFRGREDFVYRLEMGELPFVTGVFPLGAPSSSQASVQLTGWNLEATTLKMPACPEEGRILQTIQARNGEAVSNPVPFQRDDKPETLEQEPNDGKRAQPLQLPVIVNGLIETPGDVDTFKFEAKAGMEFVAEVNARRLNSPLDSILKLTGPDGKPIASNDDFEDKAAGLTTHQADSMLSVKLPANGTYIVELADAQRKGGRDYAYRLRLGEPQPDFELRIVPSSVNVRAGGTVPLDVHAMRKDGFNGEVMLYIDGEDHGITLSGARVPPGQQHVKITLSAPASNARECFPVRIEGRAIVGGKIATRPAVPAEDMMQAFFYRHLVPAEELMVSVGGGFPQRLPIKIVSEIPVKIPSGGTASIRFSVPRFAADRAKIDLADAPEGITIQKTGTWAAGTEVVLACEAGKASPGTRGNLIFEPSFARAQNAKKAAGGNRNPLGSLPAVPFEVVGK